jgi:hypothetical protein
MSDKIDGAPMALDGKANPALVRQLIVLQDSKNNW